MGTRSWFEQTMREICCCALGLNWALIVKSLKIVWAHCWNIWMCNRDAVWYHQRNHFVRYKEINLISFMRTHKKNSLASQTQTYKAAATKLYLQIEFFMFLLDIDCSCFSNIIYIQFVLLALSYFMNKSLFSYPINITCKNLRLSTNIWFK